MALFDGVNAPTLSVQFDMGKKGLFILGFSTLGGTDVLTEGVGKNLIPDSATEYTINCATSTATAPARNGYQTNVAVSSAAGNMTVYWGAFFTENRLQITPGEVYELSMYVRSDAVSRTANVAIDWYNATGSLLSTSTSTAKATSTSAWTLLTVQATAPATAFAAIPEVNFLSAAGSLEKHYFTQQIFWQNNWTSLPMTDVRQVAIRRGRTREDQAVQPGELTVTLDNWSGNYSPSNPSSTYWTNGLTMLTAGLPVRVQATWSGITYTLYTGYIEQVDSDVSLDPITTITCVDAMAFFLAKGTRRLYVGSDRTVSQMNEILNGIGWQGLWIGPTYATSRQVDQAFTNQNITTPLDQLECSRISEFGVLYVTGDNTVVLKQYEDIKSSPLTMVLSDSRATGTIEYDSIEIDPGAKYIVNAITVFDANEFTFTSTDTASQTLYGSSNNDWRTNLSRYVGPGIPAPSLEGQALANIIANYYSRPIRRVTSVSFGAYGIDGQWDEVLTSDLGSNVKVERTTRDGRNLFAPSIIESLSHDITPNSWRITLECSPAVVVGGFTIGTSTLGSSDSMYY